MHKLTLVVAATILMNPAWASEYEGDYLYKVTTVRAAPSTFSSLLDRISALKATSFFEDAGILSPMIMRHSQGDQWDFLLVAPMSSWQEFHSTAATLRRDRAAEAFAEQIGMIRELIAFSEDHFAYGPPIKDVRTAFESNNFFHIEMFEAAAGKSQELLQQRDMENDYLAKTGQTRNIIFRRAAGSNIDVFTIGFHESLQAFAAPAGVTDAENEIAAKSAGFKNLADISFYLRSLITGHHDTLANKVN